MKDFIISSEGTSLVKLPTSVKHLLTSHISAHRVVPLHVKIVNDLLQWGFAPCPIKLALNASNYQSSLLGVRGDSCGVRANGTSLLGLEYSEVQIGLLHRVRRGINSSSELESKWSI